ncbi:MAG TPA: SDR family NAD(P)-dependent oxidoreductase [Ktedonobacteraceae bacterium]|nr:SDR family NAD(P)-dependent oxidoreductase [Ktedonobacteraceae bacterium]
MSHRQSMVITGCSSGFGRVTALELARLGWHVIATVRKTEDQESLLAQARHQRCEQNITPLLCDITHEDQVAELQQQVAELLSVEQNTASPSLTALVNNAGTAYAGPIELLALDDLRKQMEINCIAHVAMIQAFLPLLKAAHGTIINIGSISGKITTPLTGAYSASKYALEAISDALRIELAYFGVRVVLIEPSSSPTSIWQTSIERSITPQQRASAYAPLLVIGEKVAKRSSRTGFPPQRVAQTVVRILTSEHPRARYPVPFQAKLIIFVRGLLPDSLWDRLTRRALKW